jgi:hypothetical protein
MPSLRLPSGSVYVPTNTTSESSLCEDVADTFVVLPGFLYYSTLNLFYISVDR